MPYCEVSGNGAQIFYRKYGRGRTKILLIIGLAGTHESWEPQIRGLTGGLKPSDGEQVAETKVSGDGERPVEEEGVEVCCFDNRGIGRSSVPKQKSEYTTTIMAKDALGLLDHLGWRRAHVFGHSMGGMIACKLAAMAPDRLCSLALLNVSGGGFQCFPKIDRQVISLAFRFLRARTPEERASVDLETHFTKDYLDEYDGSCTRRNAMHKAYVKALSSSGLQPAYGFEGQVNACWTHNMTPEELDTVCSSGFLITIIHGRYDIVAQLEHAQRLAKMLQPAAKMVEIFGGHLVSHERPNEVNLALKELLEASKLQVKPEEWSSSSERDSVGRISGTRLSWKNMVVSKTTNLTLYSLLGRLQFNFLYFIWVLFMGYEHMRGALKVLKPVKVAPSDS